MSDEKTLAMKLLEGQRINYSVRRYPPEQRDAEMVAAAIGADPEEVYKSLVVLPPQHGRPPTKPLLVLVPAHSRLHLKKVARALGVKKVKMAAHKEAEALTGLKVGGISPLMLLNKGFAIYLDQSAQERKRIFVSAGQRGLQIQIAVADLVRVTSARWMDAADAE